MSFRPAFAVVLITALVVGFVPGSTAAATVPDAGLGRPSVSLRIAPRLQWNANYGYCGETSFISAGMHVGQYASQWTVRGLASPGRTQTRRDSQLLLGVNDLRAARSMRLQVASFDGQNQRSTPEFLSWVKTMVLRGHPVIMGVFLNMRLSEGVLPGDAEYDHIVPVLAITSQAPLSVSDHQYRPTDVLTFSDNSGANASSIYRSSFRSIQRSRAAANHEEAPMYSLPNRPINYATAVIGVEDPDHVTIPIRLTASSDGEGVHDEPWLAAPPSPRPVDITATVTIPNPSLAYRVYLYDDFAKVPIRDFNASASQSLQSWTIPPGSGSTWTQTITIMSDQTRAFRAVPATAS